MMHAGAERLATKMYRGDIPMNEPLSDEWWGLAPHQNDKHTGHWMIKPMISFFKILKPMNSFLF